jgi:toxin-antitoxin system PIN domain toxin
VIVPDANLLLYACDRDSTFFDASSSWWAACLNGTEPVGLCHAVIFAFVRIATNPRIFARPLTLEVANGVVSRWFERGVTRILLPDEQHHTQVMQLLAGAGAAGGNLVTDAQIAAIALAHGAVVHTADQDFRRFPGLRCHYPLQDE